jgi:large subunit ribosomal protein L32
VAVPKRKKTRSRRDMRRAHHDKVTAPELVWTEKNGGMMVPRRLLKALDHMSEKELRKLGLEAID